MSRLTALDFTFAQSTDLGTLTFTETSGNGVGAYDGTPDYSEVKNTILKIKFPDDTESYISKGYLPTQNASPNGSQPYVPSDFGYSAFPNGVWDVTFKVYTTDTASGALVQGTEYIVTGGSIQYNLLGDGNLVTLAADTVFTASSTLTYTEVTPAEVNVLEGEKTCNVLVYGNVQDCIRTLLLQRCASPCDCREDFHEAMNELVIDITAAQVAFNNNNYKCANDTIQRLAKACGGICNDCGC